MAKQQRLPRYTEEGKLPRYGGAAQVSDWDIAKLTAGTRARGQFGGALAQAGQRFLAIHLKKKAEYQKALQRSLGNNILYKRILEDFNYVESLKENPNFDSYVPNYTKQALAWNEAEIAKVTDPFVKLEVGDALEKRRIDMEMQLSGLAEKNRNAETVRNGYDAFDRLLEAGEMGDEMAFEEAIEIARDLYEEGNTSRPQYQDMLEKFASAYVRTLGYKAGKKWLSATDKKGQFVNLPEMDEDKRKIASNNLDFWQADKMRADKAALMQIKEGFYQKLISGDYLDLQGQVNTSPLPVEDVGGKVWWTKLIRAERERLLKGEEIVTNQAVKGDIRDMAYDIWTGFRTKEEVIEAARRARYSPDIPDNQKINDASLNELEKLAQQEFKSFQAGKIKNILSFAKTQLIDVDDGTFEAMMQFTQGKGMEILVNKRQKQYWNFNQYERALRDWVARKQAKEKDPTAYEIQAEADRLLPHYRKRSTADIEQLMNIKEAAAITVSEIGAEQRQRAKLKRIRVRAPDGREGTIPEEKREEALRREYIILE